MALRPTTSISQLDKMESDALARAKAAITRLGDIRDYMFLDVKSHGVIYSTMAADQVLKFSQTVERIAKLPYGK